MFFNDWESLARLVIVAPFAYAGIVLLLRISGKRTLSKMNAFDLIVTVALGSMLATILLSKDVALAEGLTGFALLIGLQFAITWWSVRSRRVEDMVKAEPSLLFFEGRFLDEALRSQRITRTEILATIRSQGVARLQDVAAVVLETDGSMSVLRSTDGKEASTLQDVA